MCLMKSTKLTKRISGLTLDVLSGSRREMIRLYDMLNAINQKYSSHHSSAKMGLSGSNSLLELYTLASMMVKSLILELTTL